MLRRISLTAVVSVIFPGSVTQLIVAYLIAISFTLLSLVVQPYALRDDGNLVTITQLATSGTFFVTVLLKLNLITRTQSAVLLITLALIPLVATAYVLRVICTRSVVLGVANSATTSLRRMSRPGPHAMKSGRSDNPDSPAKSSRNIRVLPVDEEIDRNANDGGKSEDE